MNGSKRNFLFATNIFPVISGQCGPDKRLTAMKNCCCRLAYFWILLAMPFVAMASTSFIWVPNWISGTIDVIDPITNKVVQTIEGIEKPHGVAFSPDGS